MEEGLIVLRDDGSVQAFDRAAERIVGLDAGQLLIGADFGAILGRDAVQRLFAAAPRCESDDVLGSGEVWFELGGASVTAMVTRLSASMSTVPCVLVRLRSAGGISVDAGRDLAARLSRELRAPLAAIRGCSQTLLSGALEEAERARRFVEMMEDNADQIEMITHDLDSLAQVQPDWVRDNRRAVDIRPILGWTARIHATTVIRRGVAVRALPLANDIVVAAVPQLFERSLRGVVGELVRVASRGEEITCGAARVAAASDETLALAEIAVERRVGGAASSSRSDDDGSSSLRMETVRDVVRSHGGWLASRCVAGRLATIKLFWPLWAGWSGATRSA